MPTLPSKADKIHKLAAQLQYNIDNWDAHHREEDRATILSAARTMKKYLDIRCNRATIEPSHNLSAPEVFKDELGRASHQFTLALRWRPATDRQTRQSGGSRGRS